MAIVGSLRGFGSLTGAACLSAVCVIALGLAAVPAAKAQMLGSTEQQAPVERAPQGAGQQSYGAQGYGQPGYGALPPVSPVAPNGAPALPFETVMASAYSQTAFTFDRSMLGLADGFFANSDAETKRVVAGLNSISVHTYRAREFARYDAGALATIDAQYRAAGWKHMVNANAKDGSALTDLWLHFAGPNITGVTVLSRGDRTMSVVNVDCELRPLDMLHLSGHFGIPKVDPGAVMVPAK